MTMRHSVALTAGIVVATLFLVLVFVNNNNAYGVREENIELKGANAYAPFQLTIQHAPTQNKTLERQAPALCSSCLFQDSVSHMTLSINETTFYRLKYQLNYSDKPEQEVQIGIWSDNRVVQQMRLPMTEDIIVFNFDITTDQPPRYPTPFEILQLQFPYVSQIPDMNERIKENTYVISNALRQNSITSLYGAIMGTLGLVVVVVFVKTGAFNLRKVITHHYQPPDIKNMTPQEKENYRAHLQKQLTTFTPSQQSEDASPVKVGGS